MEKYEPLKQLISKQENSLLFRARLNRALIQFVRTEAKLYLYPCHAIPNVYLIDESIPLKQEKKLKLITLEQNTLIDGLEQLTASQAYDLYQWYENKCYKILEAQTACKEFTQLINDQNLLLDELSQLSQDDDAAHSTLDIELISLLKEQGKSSDEILNLSRVHHTIKNRLLNLYIIFKPYFIEITPEPIDHYLTKRLSETYLNTEQNYTFQVFFSLHLQSKKKLIDSCEAWKKRRTYFIEFAQERFLKEYQETTLQHEPEHRAHHLIKHTNFSKGIYDFRIALFKITSLFNKAMQKQLSPQSIFSLMPPSLK